MANDWFEELKAACGLVDTGDDVGTGYLVGERQVMTCEHVVRSLNQGDAVTVTFGDQELHGTLIKKDEASDSALLELEKQPEGLTPLRFARMVVRQAVWDGYGFPDKAGIALPLRGTVMDPTSRDKKKRQSLLLFSDQIATKPDIHGMSGSPIVVNGYVIGHLKRIIGDEDDDWKPTFGYVFATPSDGILTLLDITPAVETVEAEESRQLCIPSIPDERCHAFISSNSANRAFAKRLLHLLEAKGFRVAADGISTKDAIAMSNAAIIVLSREYVDSALSRSEGHAIRAQRGLRIIPVRVDDVSIPVEWTSVLAYDFSGLSKPDGPVLEQLMYAVAGQRPSVSAVNAMASAPSEANPGKVEADPGKARVLINAGLPELALRYLPATDTDLRVRQVRALALAKNRQLDEAVGLLEQLKQEGHLDGETGGLLAGRYKQRWEDTDNPLWFAASLETYRSAWNASNPPDPYPGINLASMLLESDQDEASRIARRIIEVVGEGNADFWGLATIAEAWLLLGETQKALGFYRRMIAAGPERYENIASARRTLRRDLALLKVPAEPFEKLLALPAAIAFVGHDIDAADRPIPRFPREREDEVRQMIAGALRELRVMYGVSSASAGSDIIFLEQMKELNAFVRVILPCERGRFMQEFLNKEWRRRFEWAMDYPRAEVVELDEGDPEDLWENLGPKLWSFAKAIARQLDNVPTLLAVWDGKPGFIDATIDEWRRKGAPIKHLPLAQTGVPGEVRIP